MNENFTLDNIENDDLTETNEDSDYQKLITILKEISLTIALLEKTIS